MVKRFLVMRLRAIARKFPVVTVTGPRQSGKTTLIQSEFKDAPYVSLEDPDHRAFATEDPRGFLSQFDGQVILDEAQRVPELFSYIQTIVDRRNKPGQFILSGSHNFLLMQSVTQSLAGRSAVLHLLPFSLAELQRRPPLLVDQLGLRAARHAVQPRKKLFDLLFSGLYPRIHDKKLDPTDFLSNYYQLYVERDVRQLVNIGDLAAFNRFVRLCAGRAGQVLSLSGLASDCGISHTTAARWMSQLEASFLVVLLQPYYRNFGKRMIKAPKLYFLDTGLLCYLLGIKDARELETHSQRGAIFETFVISELYKNFYHRGLPAPLYYWRNSSGLEIDVLVDLGGKLVPVELKSAQTIVPEFFDGLHKWNGIAGQAEGPAALIYGGKEQYRRSGVSVYPWWVM